MKTLKQIIKHRIERAIMYERTEGEKGIDIEVDRLLEELDAYYKSRVPKKKDTKGIGAWKPLENIGYNKCIADLQEEW